ncbi:membrane hypothetical protein [Capnocytophaga canimorsus]|uniref:CNNM transmembrane domain-containing protein n=1 Tax=Capnocytophaga canimorsus TaxID=28188 RepID=A0A0B7INJ1_9FLAO|nr:membrane hypothetical protein [Capnocytophaga canimorsus]
MDSDPPSLFLTLSTIDTTLIVQFVAFLALLLCSALISGAEVALFSFSSTEVNAAREDGTPTGKIIANLLDSPKKLLATILIANNLINISIVLLFVDLGDFLFGKVDYQLFDIISLKTIIDVGLVTFLILLFW